MQASTRPSPRRRTRSSIGNGSTPLKVPPSIYLNSINNLVFDSASTTIPTTPITTPSVQIIVNGVIKNFDIVAASQGLDRRGLPVPVPGRRDDRPHRRAGDGHR